ncbi:MAG: ABC transporter permease [Bacteroidota bacterium]|nr:ABC transporter permease [Bacteroidota bacterium]MDP4212920.1 ABC transporter permease [Bacteroidota bacterium]MDP4249571.1 ABC transporter permease [Bacteroidota bacterium]
MHTLKASIIKDLKILVRDRMGLLMMFFMPVLLVIVITSVQNSTFELVNNNKITLLACNRDSGPEGTRLISAIEKIGMFRLLLLDTSIRDNEISVRMHAKDALVAVVIPDDFSASIQQRASDIASRALSDPDSASKEKNRYARQPDSLLMFYHPVMQPSFRQSIKGALHSAVQVIQGEAIAKSLYSAVNSKAIPPELEKDILFGQIPITEIPVSRSGSRVVPNASQHNVPAWTIFAMFFVVVSLGSSVVREKISGSFIRLKTLPSSYLNALVSKQVVYIMVTFLQAAVIFAVGNLLFPHIGLPVLHLPKDIPGLILITLACGWCAASYAICVGVFSETPEQANGFGAISIVILAALGGLLVPSFAMPANMQQLLRVSPLHWGLEAYYALFLEGGKLKDVLTNILSLAIITIGIQLLTLYGLKKKNLI